MLFILTTHILIPLSLQLTPVKESILKFHSDNEDRSSSSSSDTSSSTSLSSEENTSTELTQAGVQKPSDVLALFVVDNSRFPHGRRGKLLEPYQTLSLLAPAQPTQRRVDEANALSKLRNTNHVKNKPVNRKGDPKELYQKDAKPISHAEQPKVLQTEPLLEELLGMKNEGLAIQPFPDVKVLPLDPKESARDAEQYTGDAPNEDHTNDDEDKTYTVKKHQLLALRKRWSKKCDKAAYKECNKACKRAMKMSCSDFKCKRGLKKQFKRECKRNCKRRFVLNGGGCSG